MSYLNVCPFQLYFLTPSKKDFLLIYMVNIKYVFSKFFYANLNQFTDNNGWDAEHFHCSAFCAF